MKSLVFFFHVFPLQIQPNQTINRFCIRYLVNTASIFKPYSLGYYVKDKAYNTD